jgi:PAS domain S-box-containing protein
MTRKTDKKAANSHTKTRRGVRDTAIPRSKILRNYFVTVGPVLLLTLLAALGILRLHDLSLDSFNSLEGGLLLLVLLTGAVAVTTTFIQAKTLIRVRNRERASRRYHYLQETFFEKNPEIMFVKNLDGTYVSANAMCRRLAAFEGQAEDVIGKNRAEIFPDRVATTLQQQDQQVIENTEPMEFFTQWKRDEVTYHYKTLRFPIFDEAGEITALGGIANDITDQALARKALQESEQLVRTFIESAPEGVIICDIEGGITLVNRQAELIFGFSRDELLSKSLFDLVISLSEADLRASIENSKLISEEVFREAKEARGVNNNNRNFPLELLLAPVSTNEGALIICLLRDISEKMLMETQLRQSQKMEAIGKLTGGMAHDFNNLLGVIIGNIDLALRKFKEDTAGTKSLLTARQAAERGADLTKRMLAVARQQPLQPKAVSINSVIKELWEMLPQTLGPDIEMHLELDDKVPPIIVDESGLEGIMLNLAINARDAMPEGGRFCVTTALRPGEELSAAMPTISLRNATYAYIAVEDSGTGMSPETVSRAFEPFFSTKEKGKGSGLGLAMIYGFVKQSKGYIFIDSELGRGTRIDIYLPVSAEITVDEVEVDTLPHETDSINSETTVLVVDDEPELLEIATSFLEELGYSVLSARGGQEALGVLAKRPGVDVLITDVVMPGGMSGVALSKTARQLYPKLSVVYVSGYPTDIIEENSGNALEAPLINKPYNRASLASGILEAMHASQMRS